MQHYHPSIAVAYFARRLAASAQGARGKYQASALLAYLWLYVEDQQAASPVVYVSDSRLAAVAEGARLRQLVRELRDVGAIERAGSSATGKGYRLFKPSVDDLDAQGRGEARGFGSPEEDAEERALGRRPAARHVLAAASKVAGREVRRSDIRDMLADMAGIERGELLYAGPHARAVSAAIDALGRMGWADFTRLIYAVQRDPRKPDRVLYLFDERLAEYRARMLGERNDGQVSPTETTASDDHPVAVLETRRIAPELTRDNVVSYLARFVSRDLAESLADSHIEAIQRDGVERMQSIVSEWRATDESARPSLADRFAEVYAS